MLVLFDSGDKEYFQWMKDNPESFILNTGKGKNTSIFVLHRTNCMHLVESDNFDNEAYTMKGWIKIGAHDVENIVEYCWKNKRKFDGVLKLCKSCEPEYFIKEIVYPEEIVESQDKYTEGAKKAITINSYERNPLARKRCIEHFGVRCQCCNLSFEEKYGSIGENFIHVHHLKQISDIGKEYQVDPIKDLIPLCPNCHAMIHKRNPPFSIQQLRDIIGEKL